MFFQFKMSSAQHKNVATIDVVVVGPIKTLVKVEIDSINSEKVLVVTMKPKTHLKGNMKKVHGLVQVTIVDQLGEKHKLNIPATALLQSTTIQN